MGGDPFARQEDENRDQQSMADTFRYVPVKEGFSHFLSRFSAGDIAGAKQAIVELSSEDTLVHGLEVSALPLLPRLCSVCTVLTIEGAQ